MVPNNQQPNVRRRLNFEDMDDIEMQHDHPLPGDRGTGNAPLPRLPGDDQSDSDYSFEETDTESTPGSPERHPLASLRVLHQGFETPRQINRPRPGMATVIARDANGFTTIYYLPIGQVQLAFADGEETESEGHSDGDEESD